MKTTGIYAIAINNKFYIGSSLDVKRRWVQHKSDLNRCCHCNQKLQHAYNKYKKIKFFILEECDVENLYLKEKKWFDNLNPFYNIQDPLTNFNIKPVYKFTLDGKLITMYSSVIEAANETLISYSNIQHAAQENETLTKSAGGFLWSYTNKIKSSYVDLKWVTLYVYDIEGNYLNEFKSVSDACRELFPNKSFQTINKQIYLVCQNKACSIDGLRFSFDKLDKLNNEKLLVVTKNFPIVQCSYNNKEQIKIWNTTKEAAISLGIKTSEITNAIKKNRRTAGYCWYRLGQIKTS